MIQFLCNREIILPKSYGDRDCWRRENFFVNGGKASRLSLRGNIFLFPLGIFDISLWPSIEKPPSFLGAPLGCINNDRFSIILVFGRLLWELLEGALWLADFINSRPSLFIRISEFVKSLWDEWVWIIWLLFCSGWLQPRNFNLALRPRFDLIFVSCRVIKEE